MLRECVRKVRMDRDGETVADTQAGINTVQGIELIHCSNVLRDWMHFTMWLDVVTNSLLLGTHSHMDTIVAFFSC